MAGQGSQHRGASCPLSKYFLQSWERGREGGPRGPPSTQESVPSCVRLCRQPGIFCTPASCGEGPEGEGIPHLKGIRAPPPAPTQGSRAHLWGQIGSPGIVMPEPDSWRTGLDDGVSLQSEWRQCRNGRFISSATFRSRLFIISIVITIGVVILPSFFGHHVPDAALVSSRYRHILKLTSPL